MVSNASAIAREIDFIYEDECPNVAAARANLEQALDLAGLPPRWVEHRIGTAGVPERAPGFGSPTILVDGRDAGGAEPGAEQCCRVYANGSGVPSVESTVGALRESRTPCGEPM